MARDDDGTLWTTPSKLNALKRSAAFVIPSMLILYVSALLSFGGAEDLEGNASDIAHGLTFAILMCGLVLIIVADNHARTGSWSIDGTSGALVTAGLLLGGGRALGSIAMEAIGVIMLYVAAGWLFHSVYDKGTLGDAISLLRGEYEMREEE